MKKSKIIIISYILVVICFMIVFNAFYISLNNKNRMKYNITLNNILYEVSLKYPLVNSEDII